MSWAGTRSRTTFRLTSGWGILVVSLAAGLMAGGLVALFWPTPYTATASFFISDPAALLGTMLKPTAGWAENAEASNLRPTSERLGAILASHMLRAKLVKKHKLAERMGVEPAWAEELLAQMAKITPLGNEGFSIAVTCKGYGPVRVALTRAFSREEARQLCAALANDYLTELQQYVTQTSISEARKRREFIQHAQRQVLTRLAQIQAEMARLQRHYTMLDPESKASLLNDRIRTLEAAEAEDQAKLAETRKALAKAQAQLGRTATMRVSSIVEQRNPIIAQVEQKIADLQLQLATAEAQGKTRQHPEVLQILAALETAQQQLAALRKDVRKEMAQSTNPTYEKVALSVADLQVTLSGLEARTQRTAALLRAARQELAALPPLAQRYAALKQDQEIQMQALASLKQSLAVALVQEQQSQRVGEFLILDRATPPADLYGPPVLLTMLITTGAVLAILGLININRLIFGA